MIKVLTVRASCDFDKCTCEGEGTQQELEEKGWMFHFHCSPYVEEGRVYCKEHAKRVWT